MSDPEILPRLVLAGCLAAVLVLAIVRVVPAGERLVIVRDGRPPRLGGPGLVAVLPGLERMVRVSLRESRLEPVVTRATTRDGVTVWITLSALFRVVDPVRSCVGAADANIRVAEVLEREARRELADTCLEHLAGPCPEVGERLRRAVNVDIARWGAELSDVEILGVEVQLTPELLRWARRPGLPDGQARGAGTV